jgi:uncharacterized iron-regulated membrane protein
MGLTIKFFGFLFLAGLVFAPLTLAQSRAASATPAGASAGRPSTLAIRENILAMQRANIEEQIEEARRCIQDAANPTILRDPEGNVNRVPSTDIVNCSRRLAQLQRQLEGVARQAQQLSVDAQFQAAQAQRRLQQEKSRLTIQELESGGSPSAFRR